jgi:hypothetical protein
MTGAPGGQSSSSIDSVDQISHRTLKISFLIRKNHMHGASEEFHFEFGGVKELLRQSVLPVDVKMAAHAWRSRIRLSSADANPIVALSDHWIALLCHHP